jgi:hypothetical protein
MEKGIGKGLLNVLNRGYGLLELKFVRLEVEVGVEVQYLYVGTVVVVSRCVAWYVQCQIQLGMHNTSHPNKACRECVSNKLIDDARVWDKAASHVCPSLGGMYSRAI